MNNILDKITEICLNTKSVNVIEIFNDITKSGFVRMHGPEHHIIDGAVILTAYKNAGGSIDLKEALDELRYRGLQMPGAICGMWGVCGSVTSIGAALSIIDGTGPVSVDESWGNHMKYASKALEIIGETGGPRCCKRDGVIAIMEAAKHVNEKYNLKLELDEYKCGFSKYNQQCIKERCPFFKAK